MGKGGERMVAAEPAGGPAGAGWDVASPGAGAAPGAGAKRTGMRANFVWAETGEPHIRRRKLILAKYPHLKKLQGPDPWFVPPRALCVIALQCALAYAATGLAWWQINLLAYCVGAFCNQNLFLAIHELSHNLAFKKAVHNKLFGLLCNLPTCVQVSTPFTYYHRRHHVYMGDHHMDQDIPTKGEANLICNTVSKFVWAFFQVEVYALRPMFSMPKPPTAWDAAGWAACIAFDLGMLFGLGPKALGYLALSSHWSGSVHPIAGHFLTEHYLDLISRDDPDRVPEEPIVGGPQETYSYYGALNLLTYNVGYHNEHHDFPQVPGSRLPLIRAAAPEFYEPLQQYNSWVHVMFKYITDPTIGPYSRVKRHIEGTAAAIKAGRGQRESASASDNVEGIDPEATKAHGKKVD